MLSERQEHLLQAIIREYTRTAQPVGSAAIVDRAGFDVSPATIRNDMAELETSGYLRQPHTSAGRIPTEKAWRHALAAGFGEAEVNRTYEQRLNALLSDVSEEPLPVILRAVARTLAEWTTETVAVAFSPHDLYYTGLSNLFRQPEFATPLAVQRFSLVVDHLDDVVADLYAHIGDDVIVYVGRDNPFSAQSGAIVARYRCRGTDGMVVVLGPMRQPYHEHVPLVRFTTERLRQV